MYFRGKSPIQTHLTRPMNNSNNKLKGNRGEGLDVDYLEFFRMELQKEAKFVVF